MELERSSESGARLATLVPGGSHTYAKGADQYPTRSPAVLSHGRGSHVWDLDGNEYIEYGMGLRAVGLGHAYPDVVDAVQRSLAVGTNFTRPSLLELECAERFVELLDGADMVKFTKDGSTATTAALKLARRSTGRDMVAVCADSPFFSYDDWFICTTPLDGGIPASVADLTTTFRYNDLPSLEAMFDEHPAQIAAVFMEVVRTDPPEPGFLDGVRRLCDRHGALLVLDEMITGFRHALPGAQHEYGIEPDISTWGKAIANGFALSVLSGKREIMRLGSKERSGEDAFLLSTTHGAESVGLAAAMATLEVYRTRPVIEHLHRQGDRLADGLRALAARHGVAEHVRPIGFGSNLVFATTGPDGAPSQAYRSLLLQEMARHGVLMPSLVVSYSHSDADVDDTLSALDAALSVYAKALEDGTERHLVGRPSRPVFSPI